MYLESAEIGHDIITEGVDVVDESEYDDERTDDGQYRRDGRPEDEMTKSRHSEIGSISGP